MPLSPRPRAAVTALVSTLSLVTGLLVLVLTSATSASATTSSITASEDTYSVRAKVSRNTTHGDDQTWSVDGRKSDQRLAFVKFHVPAPAAGTSYVGARLRALSDGSGSTGSGPVAYTTNSSWSESTLTWSNQPSRGVLLGSSGGYGAGSWVTWDVSAALPATGGTVSFRLETTDRALLAFQSSEGTDAPQLVLTSEPLASANPSPSTSTSTSASPAPTPTTPPAAGSTAAQTYGWGTPVAGDEFGYTGSPDSTKWNLYNSAGHAGNGVRSPAAWSVDGSVARVSGDAQGTTGGMSAKFGRRTYGRWEARMRTSARDSEYHPVLLLWPDSGGSCDGEIDYAEGTADVTKMRFFYHYSCSNYQTSASRTVDTTQWHNYAVEWTSAGVIGYLDGVEWFRDTDPTHQPPGPMHQTVQLDWFPDGTTTTPSWMEVDWVRVYDPQSGPDLSAPDTTITSGPAAQTTSTSASFAFTSSESASTFECRLDAAAWTPCTSPAAYSSVPVGSHTFAVRAIDAAGNVDPSPATRTWEVTTGTSSPPSPGTGNLTLAAVGDLNPDGQSSTTGAAGRNAASIAAAGVDAVTVLGDFQYTYGDCGSLVNELDKTGWGALMPKLIGTAGPTHDWSGGTDVTNYRSHLGGTCSGQTSGRSLSSSAWGSDVGPDTSHWVDLGSWRVFSVSSGLWRYDSAKASAVTSWLDSELAKAVAAGDHPLVIWHEPYWTSTSSGHGPTTAVKPWIDVLDKYDVPLVLSGHQHGYERFYPQNANSTRNDATGTQQFVVGTGGIGFYSWSNSAPNLATHQADTYGWLKLVLRADGSYDWQFVRTGGGSYTDSGTRPAG